MQAYDLMKNVTLKSLKESGHMECVMEAMELDRLIESQASAVEGYRNLRVETANLENKVAIVLDAVIDVLLSGAYDTKHKVPSHTINSIEQAVVYLRGIEFSSASSNQRLIKSVRHAEDGAFGPTFKGIGLESKPEIPLRKAKEK